MSDLLISAKVAFSGAGVTLSISALAVLIGLALGLVVALGKMSHKKPIRVIASVYVDILRGTPLVVQALLVYFGIPMLLQGWGVHFIWPSAFIASFLVCGINSSAYVAEIIRSGLQAIDPGQAEAARSLGMTHGQTMRHIIIPQAIRIIIPALGNEFISLIKETAILSIISVTDVTRASMLFASRGANYFPAYLGTAVVYLIMTIPLSKFMNYVERKLAGDVRS